ncbi:MAG: sensor histidine kinase [bacterium]
MIKSLYGKLSVVLLSLFLLMGLLFISLTLVSNRMYFLEASQKLNRSVAKRLVSNRMLIEGGKINQQALQQIYSDLMDINPAMKVYLLDPNGHILSASVSREKIKRDHVSMEPVFAFLSGRSHYPILGDNPVDPGAKQIFSACPIPITGSPEAYLYIVLGGTDDEPIAGMLGRSRIVRMSIYVAVAGLVLVSFFGLYLFNSLTRRLREVTNSVKSFREDGLVRPLELKHDLESEGGDEIDRLSSVFGRMAERINDQMAELKNADSLWKELITNVSHDLRTPLTSLQGYLETLLLKEDLTEDQRSEYLHIALKHSDRLRKLISDLFELSRLDAREVQISPEEFSLCELTQDILQKFSLSAQEKGILLIPDFGRELPFVSADIGLVERALENLIQNAIQYTPTGGSVTVSIEPTADRLVIKVVDTGRGIDEENLPAIFDRYYRIDDGERDTTAGAGLGLAITKRIVELHGESLEVTSTVGVGTEFFFGLPVSSPESHECRDSD